MVCSQTQQKKNHYGQDRANTFQFFISELEVKLPDYKEHKVNNSGTHQQAAQ
jgi:hypothetical protein